MKIIYSIDRSVDGADWILEESEESIRKEDQKLKTLFHNEFQYFLNRKV